MIEGLKKGIKPTGRNILPWKFPKSTVDFAASVSWQSLRSGYVKENTEAIIMAAQDQVLRTNWIKANIDEGHWSSPGRVSQSVDESSMRIASRSKQLTKWRYMITRSLIATRVRWKLCKKYEIKVPRNWYEHVPLPNRVTQKGIQILWVVEIRTTTKIKHNKPDIVVKMP